MIGEQDFQLGVVFLGRECGEGFKSLVQLWVGFDGFHKFLGQPVSGRLWAGLFALSTGSRTLSGLLTFFTLGRRLASTLTLTLGRRTLRLFAVFTLLGASFGRRRRLHFAFGRFTCFSRRCGRGTLRTLACSRFATLAALFGRGRLHLAALSAAGGSLNAKGLFAAAEQSRTQAVSTGEVSGTAGRKNERGRNHQSEVLSQ